MTSVVVSLPATVREIQVARFGAGATGDTDYTLTAGAATLALPPTGADWCYRFTEHGGGGRRRFCVVPDVASVAYADLVDVDPGTLATVAEPASPAWEAVASAALTAALAKVNRDALRIDVLDHYTGDHRAAIISALALSAATGGVVELNGTHTISDFITVPSGASIDGSRGVVNQTGTLKQCFVVNGASRVRLRNIKAIGKSSDWINKIGRAHV